MGEGASGAQDFSGHPFISSRQCLLAWETMDGIFFVCFRGPAEGSAVSMRGEGLQLSNTIFVIFMRLWGLHGEGGGAEPEGHCVGTPENHPGKFSGLPFSFVFRGSSPMSSLKERIKMKTHIVHPVHDKNQSWQNSVFLILIGSFCSEEGRQTNLLEV